MRTLRKGDSNGGTVFPRFVAQIIRRDRCRETIERHLAGSLVYVARGAPEPGYIREAKRRCRATIALPAAANTSPTCVVLRVFSRCAIT